MRRSALATKHRGRVAHHVPRPALFSTPALPELRYQRVRPMLLVSSLIGQECLLSQPLHFTPTAPIRPRSRSQQSGTCQRIYPVMAHDIDHETTRYLLEALVNRISLRSETQDKS